MHRLYLRPVGDETKYSDLATYVDVAPFAAPSGYEWVEGEPPEEAVLIIKKTPLELLDEIFKAQPMLMQIAFSGMKALAKEYGEVENWEAVRAIIEQTPIPVELEELAAPIKTELLAVLDAL